MNDREYLEYVLNEAIKRGDLIRYIEALGAYKVLFPYNSIPTERPYYELSMEVYHDFHQKQPSLQLDKRFVQEIMQKLTGECGAYDVYGIYNAIRVQLMLEHQKLAAFTVDPQQMQEIIRLIQEKVDRFRAELKTMEIGVDGYGYCHNSYESLIYTERYFYTKTGRHILRPDQMEEQSEG